MCAKRLATRLERLELFVKDHRLARGPKMKLQERLEFVLSLVQEVLDASGQPQVLEAQRQRIAELSELDQLGVRNVIVGLTRFHEVPDSAEIHALVAVGD